MLTDQQRAFLAAQRVARLATADAAGRPHVVPVCYTLIRDKVYFTIDEKPKRKPHALKRLANLRANPFAALVADRYDENWSRLGWVMVQGRAEVLEAGAEHDEAQALSAAGRDAHRGAAGGGGADRPRQQLGSARDGLSCGARPYGLATRVGTAHGTRSGAGIWAIPADMPVRSSATVGPRTGDDNENALRSIRRVRGRRRRARQRSSPGPCRNRHQARQRAAAEYDRAAGAATLRRPGRRAHRRRDQGRDLPGLAAGHGAGDPGGRAARHG